MENTETKVTLKELRIYPVDKIKEGTPRKKTRMAEVIQMKGNGKLGE